MHHREYLMSQGGRGLWRLLLIPVFACSATCPNSMTNAAWQVPHQDLRQQPSEAPLDLSWRL